MENFAPILLLLVFVPLAWKLVGSSVLQTRILVGKTGSYQPGEGPRLVDIETMYGVETRQCIDFCVPSHTPLVCPA